MASQPKDQTNNKKKRAGKYVSHHASKKQKEGVDLSPGVRGFFITCDGGKERQSGREAINLFEQFFEKLQKKSQNSDSEQQNPILAAEEGTLGEEKEAANLLVSSKLDDSGAEVGDGEKVSHNGASCKDEVANDPIKSKGGSTIDKLLEEEIAELKNVKKRRFLCLDTGCHGIVFVQMRKGDNTTEPGPKEIVEAIMNEALKTKRPRTRYCLKILPVEVTCYASAAEVNKCAESHILGHFPGGEEVLPFKFAVVYEARANTNMNRMDMINAVAKLVPKPHSVDLKKPDKTIIVQIIRTVCAIGVVSDFKELSKYNLRLLTSSPKVEGGGEGGGGGGGEGEGEGEGETKS